MNLTSLIPYYTYFLALQKCNKNSDYTIHGLWIDYYNRSYPQFCNNIPFKLEELKEFRENLDINWKSCYGESIGLWKHEWIKHGTCFYPKMNLVNYFTKTLELFNKKKDTFNTKCKEKECLIEIEYIEL
jgi:ribonuclease I